MAKETNRASPTASKVGLPRSSSTPSSPNNSRSARSSPNNSVHHSPNNSVHSSPNNSSVRRNPSNSNNGRSSPSNSVHSNPSNSNNGRNSPSNNSSNGRSSPNPSRSVPSSHSKSNHSSAPNNPGPSSSAPHSHSNSNHSRAPNNPSPNSSAPRRCNPSATSSRPDHGSNSGDGYSRAAVGRRKTPGSRIAPETGLPTIAPGSSAEATAVTTFLRPPSISVSAAGTSSACEPAPLCTWDIRASGTAGPRSCGSIRIRNTGRQTGIAPMTFTSTTTMDTTSTIAAIRTSGLPSPSRCRQPVRSAPLPDGPGSEAKSRSVNAGARSHDRGTPLGVGSVAF